MAGGDVIAAHLIRELGVDKIQALCFKPGSIIENKGASLLHDTPLIGQPQLAAADCWHV